MRGGLRRVAADFHFGRTSSIVTRGISSRAGGDVGQLIGWETAPGAAGKLTATPETTALLTNAIGSRVGARVNLWERASVPVERLKFKNSANSRKFGRRFFFGGILGFRRAFLPAPPRAKIRAFSETPFSERRARRPQKIAFCRRRVSIFWRDIDKAYVLLGAINREPDGPIKNG